MAMEGLVERKVTSAEIDQSEVVVTVQEKGFVKVLDPVVFTAVASNHFTENQQQADSCCSCTQ
jgi:hypothetical protein